MQIRIEIRICANLQGICDGYNFFNILNISFLINTITPKKLICRRERECVQGKKPGERWAQI